MEGEMQKLTTQENTLSCDVSTSDEDEEIGLKAPQSPKVIRTGGKRILYSMIVLFIILCMFLLIMIWVFQDNDYSGYSHNPITQTTARIYHHNHRIYKCDDRGYDCCYIYTKDNKYQFKPRYIVGIDEQGSNCPSLEMIVYKYNQYLELYNNNANCSETKCCLIDNTEENKFRNHHEEYELLQIETESKVINGVSTCPTIPHLMYMHANNYPDPNEDLYIILALLFVFIFFMGCGGKRPSRY